MQPVADSEVTMFEIQLINAVQMWNKRIETHPQLKNHTPPWFRRAERNPISSSEKPHQESAVNRYPASPVTALQVWEKRWQVDEDRRKQRQRVASTGYETILKRLPRIKLERPQESDPSEQFCSCCSAQIDFEDALHS